MDAPALFEAVLDEGQVEALFRDLATCEPVRAQVREPERAVLSLEEAARRLRDREVRAVQVWYGHEGAAWCDTLTQTEGGVRLVRIRLMADG